MTDEQIISALRAGPLSGSPVFEEAADRLEAWKAVARRAGVCMTCAIRAPEPYGCTDCLNTGWDGGRPAGVRVLEPVMTAVERILDEESAWVARPNRKVTERIALAATIAACEVQRLCEDPALEAAGLV